MHRKLWISLVNHRVIKNSPHVRESVCLLNSESGNILLVESGILGLKIPKIQLKESGIPLTIGIQNQVSTDKGWNPVRGIRDLPRGIQNPRPFWMPLHEVKNRRFVGSQVLHQQSLNSLYSYIDRAMKTLNNMQHSKYKKGIFFQSCIMDLNWKCYHYMNFAALLRFVVV